MTDRIRLPITETQADEPEKKLEKKIERLSREVMERDKIIQGLNQEKAALEQAINAVEKEAKEKGYRAGQEAGYQHGIRQADEVKEQCLRLLGNVDQSVNNHLESLYEHLVPIVMASLYKILGQQLVKPEVALSAIQNVLSQIGHQDSMTVRVSPKHHEYISTLEGDSEPASRVRYIADDQVQIGGCIVEPDRGLLDGRIETQLKALEEVLYDTLSESRYDRY